MLNRLPVHELAAGVCELGRAIAASGPSRSDHRAAGNAAAYWAGDNAILELRGRVLNRWHLVSGTWVKDAEWNPVLSDPRAFRPFAGGTAVLDGDATVRFLDDAGTVCASVEVEARSWVAIALGQAGFLLASTVDACVTWFDFSGRVRQAWTSADGLVEPTGIDVRPDGLAFIVSDARRHQVLEFALGAAGRAVFGTETRAGTDLHQLDAPASARYAYPGVLIADTKNSRIISVDLEETIEYGAGQRLWHPRTIDRASNGALLVAEGRGGRVLVLPNESRSDSPQVVSGTLDVIEARLRQPRGAHFVARDRLLVADCRNDRCLELSTDGEITRVLLASGGLDWPRHVAKVDEGFAISDGRNGRIAVVDGHGALVRQITSWRNGDESVAFEDPHHVSLATDDQGQPLWLVTDSEHGSVIAMTVNGEAIMSWRGLADPHMAEYRSGLVTICETGRNRVVVFDEMGKEVCQVGAEEVELQTGVPMRSPRGFASLSGGRLLIVDTGNDRLLYATANSDITDVTPQLSACAGNFYFPRFVAIDPTSTSIVVSDFDNNRLVLADLAGLIGGPQ